MFQNVEDLLSGLYTFYHTSPLSRANLVNSFQVLGTHHWCPPEWVGHLLLALDHFLRGYQRLVQHLEQIQSADAQNVRGVQQTKARKYYRTVREAVVIRFCGFLHDTLTHLSNLSACLQRSTAPCAQHRQYLRSTTPDFGDTELETLVDHFKPVLETSVIHVETIPDQWTVLKVLMYQEPQSLQKMSWFRVNRSHRRSCPDLLALVDLLLSFPASTAECERGFNTMKQVKTDWRSNLKSDTLSDLLMVQLSSSEIREYDLIKAGMLWHQDSVRIRRPDFMDHAKRVIGVKSEESDEEV
ncbi:uncharacterized protein LOC115205845 [Salmo trutta]|uniref:uncharacterized protein LOC115205845 n=1 Tax=Salmo trutta TaxID=8032 RepID=UPI001130D1D0|nr:uncharacterized protein LOC115205845 [Salmo trutta]